MIFFLETLPQQPKWANFFLGKSEAITAIRGHSKDINGDIMSLHLETNSGWVWGVLGIHKTSSTWTQKTSPAIEGISLGYLSGDTTQDARKLFFHWNTQKMR